MGAEAAEEGDAEVHLLGGAVDHNADADDLPAQLFHRRHRLVDGAARGEDVVHDEHPLTGFDVKAALEGPLFFARLFGEDAPYPQLAGGFESEDDAARGRGGDHADFLLPKVVGNHSAELLGVGWGL